MCFTVLAAAVSYPDLRCSPLPGSLTALVCDSTTISRKDNKVRYKKNTKCSKNLLSFPS